MAGILDVYVSPELCPCSNKTSNWDTHPLCAAPRLIPCSGMLFIMPFSSEEHRHLHTLCPVRGLRIYVDRTQGFRKANRLFVSWSKPHVGKPVSKQRLSHWIVGAIALAYTSKGLQTPTGLRAHSTRGLATSWALFKGVSIQEVCAAACWASPHTFARFYRLNVTAPTLAHSVLSTVSS